MFGTASTLATVSAFLAGMGIFAIAWVVGVWLVCAVLVAFAAHHRGLFAPLWLLFAVVLTPLLAGLMLLLFPDRADVRMRRDARRGRGGLLLCPTCGEAVRREARRCRFCLADLTRRSDPVRTEPTRPVPSEERVEPRLN